jgi:hypothetical protein
VLDEDGEYFGCLSVNDLLKSLYKGELRQLQQPCSTEQYSDPAAALAL